MNYYRPDCVEEQVGKVGPEMCEASTKPEQKVKVCNNLPCTPK